MFALRLMVQLATHQHGPVLRLPKQHLVLGEPVPLPAFPPFFLPNTSCSSVSRAPAFPQVNHVLDQCPSGGTPVATEIKDSDCIKLHFIGLENIGNRNHTWC